MQCPTKLLAPLLEFSLRVHLPRATEISPSISLQLQITGSPWMFALTLISFLFALLLSRSNFWNANWKCQLRPTTPPPDSCPSGSCRLQQQPTPDSTMPTPGNCTPPSIPQPMCALPSQPTTISAGSSKRPSSGIQSQLLSSSPRKLELSPACGSELASTEVHSVEGVFSGGFE